MRSANNPFLATIRNKTSTSITNTNISSKTYADSNDKGRKKVRRQTISDPHAYIRYISSLIGNKCTSKSNANTLAKSTATTTKPTAIPTVNHDKSQKHCQQQQQQLQQISLQFQGITLYDDDVAKNPSNDSAYNNNDSNWCTTTTAKTTTTTIRTRETTNHKQIVTPWSWYNDDENEQKSLKQQKAEQTTFIASNNILLEQNTATIEDRLATQIEVYNNNRSNSNNNKKNNQCTMWFDTYPACRVKKISCDMRIPSVVVTKVATTTCTTTTTATRMTTKIVPSSLMAKPIRTVLRKHHSFHIQPTQQIYMKPKEFHMDQTTLLQEQNQDEAIVGQQQLIKSRYNATYGGPLVFRPLTLTEKYAFKPITDAFTITATTQQQQHENFITDSNCLSLYAFETAEEEQNSEQSEEFAQEIKSLTLKLEGNNHNNNSNSNLHAAASLEMLEALTKSNPELIYASAQPGSRRNLHEQFSALQTQPQVSHSSSCCVAANKLRAKLHAKLSASDATEQHSQQRQFYFGDDENISLSRAETLPPDQHDHNQINELKSDDDVTTVVGSDSDISANCTVTLKTTKNNGGAQVKCLINQNCREINI